jgi:hypothetical protein
MITKLFELCQKIRIAKFRLRLLSVMAVLVMLSGTTVSGDLRSEKLRAFLYRYPGTPLINHIDEILYCADKFDLDWRLYVAIAGAESTFGLRYPKDTNNLTGFNSCNTSFRSINENIYRTHEVIATLKPYERYRRTKDIKDLVYVYKGVPPYDHYISTVKFIFWKVKDRDIFETSPGKTLVAGK